MKKLITIGLVAASMVAAVPAQANPLHKAGQAIAAVIKYILPSKDAKGG